MTRKLICTMCIMAAAGMVLCGIIAPGVANSQTTTLKTCWQPEHSTYIIWDPSLGLSLCPN